MAGNPIGPTVSAAAADSSMANRVGDMILIADEVLTCVDVLILS